MIHRLNPGRTKHCENTPPLSTEMRGPDAAIADYLRKHDLKKWFADKLVTDPAASACSLFSINFYPVEKLTA